MEHLLYYYERELDNQYIADYLGMTEDEMFEKCSQLNCEPDELIEVLGGLDE